MRYLYAKEIINSSASDFDGIRVVFFFVCFSPRSTPAKAAGDLNTSR